MAKNTGLAGRIRELREDRGHSKSELARLVGVTPTAIWNWEENGIAPRSGAFSTLAKVLGVSEAFLRNGVNSAQPQQTTKTVAMIIEQARNEIAASTGMPPSKVRLNVEFGSG